VSWKPVEKNFLSTIMLKSFLLIVVVIDYKALARLGINSSSALEIP
jgi:hypothetical protein